MGGSLAKDVGELWILKTRLDHADKKKLMQQKEDFLRDCNYNMVTFQVQMMTGMFNDNDKIVSYPLN